jgi:hypothetical protein
MDIRLNVDVQCADGQCGRSTYVVVNPIEEDIVYLKLDKSHIEALPAVPVRQR